MAAEPDTTPLKRVAIVGSGCAGLAALWALNRSPHDVYLYEAADRLGGHTNTVEWAWEQNRTRVDTGFIVMNTATYPNFIRFLEKAKVRTAPTEMTFGVCRDYGMFEWAGTSLDAVFAQRWNLISPRMWRMVFDIIRFNQCALDVLMADDYDAEETIGKYLAREGYSDAFRDNYLIPMTAAVWSTGPDKCSLEFPTITLIRFLWNHHLLSTAARRPDWLTIPGGAKAYVDAIMKGYPRNHIFLNTKVTSVTNEDGGGVCVHAANGRAEVYDHVILATHGDQAHAIVAESATAAELEILSSFKTSANVAVLHSDLSLMPESRRAWSSWNYLTRSEGEPALTGRGRGLGRGGSGTGNAGSIDQVSLTYNMNILQHIPRAVFGNVLVTLNPLHEPASGTVQGRYEYRHPLYTAAAVRAQERLGQIQNKHGISYVGAWTKYGFHEDGFSSGLLAARDHLGARLPFDIADSTYSRGRTPELGLADRLLRLLIWVVQVFVVAVLDRALLSLTAAATRRQNRRTRSRPALQISLNGGTDIRWMPREKSE